MTRGSTPLVVDQCEGFGKEGGVDKEGGIDAEGGMEGGVNTESG